MLVSNDFGGRPILLSDRGAIAATLAADYLTRSNVDIREIESWKDPISGRVRYGGMPFHEESQKHINGVKSEDVPVLESLGVEKLFQQDFTALIGYRYKTGKSLARYIEQIVAANSCTAPNLGYGAGLVTIVGLPDSGKSHFFNTLKDDYPDITFIDTDTARLFWLARDLIDAEHAGIPHSELKTKCQIPYSDMAHYIFRLAFRVVASRLSQERLVVTSGLATVRHAEEVLYLNNPAISFDQLSKLPVPDERSASLVGMRFFAESDPGSNDGSHFGELRDVVTQLNDQVQQRVMYNGEFGTYPWSDCPRVLDASQMKIIGNPLMDQTALFEVVVGYANYFQDFLARQQSMGDSEARLPKLNIIDSVWRSMPTPDRENWIRDQFEKALESRIGKGGLFGIVPDHASPDIRQ